MLRVSLVFSLFSKVTAPFLVKRSFSALHRHLADFIFKLNMIHISQSIFAT